MSKVRWVLLVTGITVLGSVSGLFAATGGEAVAATKTQGPCGFMLGPVSMLSTDALKVNIGSQAPPDGDRPGHVLFLSPAPSLLDRIDTTVGHGGSSSVDFTLPPFSSPPPGMDTLGRLPIRALVIIDQVAGFPPDGCKETVTAELSGGSSDPSTRVLMGHPDLMGDPNQFLTVR
jgi:hypothetical protein